MQVSIVISMHERIGLSLSHNNSRDRGHHKHKGLDAARPLMRYVCCSPLCGRDVNPARQRCLLPRAGGLCWRAVLEGLLQQHRHLRSQPPGWDTASPPASPALSFQHNFILNNVQLNCNYKSISKRYVPWFFPLPSSCFCCCYNNQQKLMLCSIN